MEDSRMRQNSQHTAEHEFGQPDSIPAGERVDQPRSTTAVMLRVVTECAHQNVDIRALHS